MQGIQTSQDYTQTPDHRPLRVLALARYTRPGASSRVRTFQYIEGLGKEGVEVTCLSLFDDEYLHNLYMGRSRSPIAVLKAYLRRAIQLLTPERFDILWVEKELFPYLPAFIEKMFLRGRARLVLDYDDAVFHNYDLSPHFVTRWFLRDKIDTLMRFAHLTIAGNAYLAARARSAGCSSVALIPSVIDLTSYGTNSASQVTQRVSIGWIGSPSSTQYLSMIEGALASVCEEFSSHLTVVGAGPLKLARVPTKVRPWSERTEVESIREFAVGIMPLRDGPAERGKCGYKLIQYMACGLPVVASPVGVNTEIVEHGVTGFLASTQDEWREHLSVLLRNTELRYRMGQAGRRKVESRYCLQVAAPVLARLFRDTARD